MKKHNRLKLASKLRTLPPEKLRWQCDATDLPFETTADLKPLDTGSPIKRIGGKQIAVFHGHEGPFHWAIDHLEVDYLLHGHTHVVRDERVSGKRIINPGALHRAARKTVATLDVDRDELIFHEIRDG